MRVTLLIIALLMTFNFQAQGCLPEGIHFTHQEHVDNFAANYPGCTEILGKVTISSGVTSLLGLSQLRVIHGDLFFPFNPSLLTLQGLNNLTTIGGNLIVQRSALSNFSGLDGLVSIGGKFEISQCKSFVDLSGLNQLTSINRDILFKNNEFTQIGGLNNLIHLGRDFIIKDNPYLTQLNGFSNLLTIEGNMTIDENPALVRPNGLSNLEEIHGIVAISKNQALVDFVGMEKLKLIKKDFNITSNAALKNFQGLTALEAIEGGLNVLYNPNLINFSGFDNLLRIGSAAGHRFKIEKNPKLINFEGLSKLNTIIDLWIHENVSLQSFQGLNTLSTISSGDLMVIGNNFSNFEGLNNLSFISGKFIVNSSKTLINFVGLHKLEHIGYGMELLSNSAIVSLEGFTNLKSTGNLHIESCNALLNLSGLESLTDLKGKNIYLIRNIRMRSLNGIQNIDPSTFKALTIADSGVLSDCSLANICTYLYNSSSAYIRNNAPGCKDEADVLSHCAPLGMNEDISIDKKAIIFPNPTKDSFEIHTHFKIENVQIYTTLGKRVNKFRDARSYNIEDLKSGVYIVLVETDKGKIFSKLIKN